MNKRKQRIKSIKQSRVHAIKELKKGELTPKEALQVGEIINKYNALLLEKHAFKK